MSGKWGQWKDKGGERNKLSLRERMRASPQMHGIRCGVVRVIGDVWCECVCGGQEGRQGGGFIMLMCSALWTSSPQFV